MFLVFLLCLSTFSSASASAERYYYKGAAYATDLTSQVGEEYGSASSVVVLTAATAFDGRGHGKERVRAFSRCEVVKQVTNSPYCTVREMSVRLSASWSTGSDRAIDGFITGMSPRKSQTKYDLTPITYFINNYWAVAGLVGITVLMNSFSASIVHSYKGDNSAGRITFVNPGTSNVDVPSSVAYNKIDHYYSTRNQSKGVGGTFNFSYLIPPTGGILAARADAKYNVTIPSRAPYQPPLVIDVKTDEAVLPHSIGI